MGKNRTPTTGGGGQHTQRGVQTAHCYSSSLSSNFCLHLIILKHMPKCSSSIQYFLMWLLCSLWTQLKYLVLRVQLTVPLHAVQAKALQFNSTAGFPPENASALHSVSFSLQLQGINGIINEEKKRRKARACSSYFWLAFSCCWFPMPTESDKCNKCNFKIVRQQTENLFLASYQKAQTLLYCILQFSAGWALDTSTEKLKNINSKDI